MWGARLQRVHYPNAVFGRTVLAQLELAGKLADLDFEAHDAADHALLVILRQLHAPGDGARVLEGRNQTPYDCLESWRILDQTRAAARVNDGVVPGRHARMHAIP